MSLPLDPKVLLFLSLCDVQLTSLITWWAATAPDQARSTSSSPQWRKPQKGCWPAAPTISSPSSPMTTKTITCLGNGALLSRKIGRTDFYFFFPPFPHSLAGPPMSSSALFLLFVFFLPSFPPPPGYWIVSVFCSLRPSACSLLSCSSIYFLFLLNSNHFIIPPIATLIDLFAPAFITRMTSSKKTEKVNGVHYPDFWLQFVYKKGKGKKKHLLTSKFDFSLSLFSFLSFLSFSHCFVRLPRSALERIVQEAKVLCAHGRCTVTEQ